MLCSTSIVILLTFPFLSSAAPPPLRASSYPSSSITSETLSQPLLSVFETNTTSWSPRAITSYSIGGNTCNTTQLALIGNGLGEKMKLVGHGRDHLGALVMIPCTSSSSAPHSFQDIALLLFLSLPTYAGS